MVIKIALIQLRVHGPKEKILKNAFELIRIAQREKSANVVVLPESFNCLYEEQTNENNAEEIPVGQTCQMLSKAARDYGLYVVGGSIVEKCCGKLYKTCTVWGPAGELVAKYRKVHLCQTNVPNQLVLDDTKTFTPGESFSTFSVGETRIGLAICWDMRFPEFAAAYRQMGCDLLICPGVSDVYTGQMHWELLARARALDNQLFVAFCSPARDPHANLVSYGHSVVVDPWGQVIQVGTEYQEIIVADLVLKTLSEVREQIPVLKQKRTDLYELSVKGKSSNA